MTVPGGTAVLLLLAACGSGGSDVPVSEDASASGSVTGTVVYRERIALPPDAVVDVALLDVSRMDVAATTIAEQTIEPAGQVPVSFELVYDRDLIDPRLQYAVRATIRRGDNPLFVTDKSYPVLTRGNPDSVDLMLVRSGGGEAPVADAELGGTRWELRKIAGEAVTPAPGEPMRFLQFDDAGVVTGFAGCNNFTGPYTVSGTALGFGNLAVTMRACPDMTTEDRFLRALNATERYEIRGNWLVLAGPAGELASFEAWYE